MRIDSIRSKYAPLPRFPAWFKSTQLLPISCNKHFSTGSSALLHKTAVYGEISRDRIQWLSFSLHLNTLYTLYIHCVYTSSRFIILFRIILLRTVFKKKLMLNILFSFYFNKLIPLCFICYWSIGPLQPKCS